MASIDQAVRTYLAAQASVSALVSTRVYCGDVPQTATLPAISISIVSAQHAHTLKGVGGYCLSRLQVNSWAATHVASKTLAEAVRNVLQGLTQTTMGTVTVNEVELTNELDLIDPAVDGSGTPEYHVAADYRVRYQESIT